MGLLSGISVLSHVVGGAVAGGTPGSDSTGPSTWSVILLTLLGSSVVAGLLTAVLGNLRAASTARRDGYASAIRTLIARAEYPYRVRRRVSDDPDTLAGLTSRGHDLQEQLAAARTWVRSEHRRVGSLFEEALAAIDATANPATADAWNHAPVTTSGAMNLAGWGPGDPWQHMMRTERAIAFRFGWRRLVPSRWWWGLD